MTSANRGIGSESDRQAVMAPKSEFKFSPPSYKTLFTFVKKNTELARQIEAIEKTHLAELKEFKSAALNGEIDAPIFKDPKCWLYPLALMHLGEIEFWQGITAYFDVIAKAQFEDLPFYSTDKDVHLKLTSPHGIQTILLMTDDGKLTTAGIKYLRNFDEKASLNNMRYEPIDRSKLVKLLAKSSPRDRMLLAVPADAEFAQPEIEKQQEFFKGLKGGISETSPWIITENQNDKKAFLFPSIAMLNFLQQELAVDYPVVLFPGFGSVGLETLANMHAQSYHFVPLFNPFVKSNMKEAHGSPVPFWITVHEFSHIGWMGRLKKSNRDVIFGTYIPMLKEWENDFMLKVIQTGFIKNSAQLRQFNMLEKCKNKAADFDLSGLGHCKQDEVFDRYLLQVIGSALFRYKSGQKVSNQDPFGNLDDCMYFLVCYAYAKESFDVDCDLLLETLRREFKKSSYRGKEFFSLIDELVAFACEHEINASDAPIQLLMTFLALDNLADLVMDEEGGKLKYQNFTNPLDPVLTRMLRELLGAALDKLESSVSDQEKAALQKAVTTALELPWCKDFKEPVMGAVGIFMKRPAPGNGVQQVLKGPKLA